MSTAKLVLDEELGQLADLRGPASAEAYVSWSFVKPALPARAFRETAGRYTLGPMQVLTTNLVRSQRRQQTH